MRRRIGTCLLAVLMLVTLMVPALAEGGTIEIVKIETGNWTVAVDKDNPEKLIVTVKDGSAGDFELIMVQDSTGAPTAEGLFYIDQQTKAAGDVVFTVYPNTDKMKSGDTYYVFLSSNSVPRTQVASFKFDAGETGTIRYGDLDGHGDNNMKDVQMALRAYSGKLTLTEEQFVRADIAKKDGKIGDGNIGMNDVLLVLRIAGGKVDPFTLEKVS